MAFVKTFAEEMPLHPADHCRTHPQRLSKYSLGLLNVSGVIKF